MGSHRPSREGGEESTDEEILMRKHLSAMAALAVCTAFCAPARASDGHDMYAFAYLAGAFNVAYGGQAVPDKLIDGVSGETIKGTYRQTGATLSSAETWYLPGEGAPGFSLSVVGGTTVAAGAPRVGTVLDQGTSSFNVAGETLSLVPAPGRGTEPFLSVTLNGAAGISYVTTTSDNFDNATSFSSFDSVTISGSILGPRVINVPASQVGNSTVYQDGNVIISVRPSGEACMGGFGVACSGSYSAAVVISFKGVIYGKPLSGTINLGYVGARDAY
jgi:hypothetical protein